MITLLGRPAFALALAVCLLVAPGPPAAAQAAAAVITDVGPVEVVKRDNGLLQDWHRKGVFIEILVRAYQDSNGDGIGDLNGVTERLDYLKDLGISGIGRLGIHADADIRVV